MYRLTTNFNLIISVNNILTNFCHSEYSKCPPLARMQAWRRLRHWSMLSSITLCSTPTHTSIIPQIIHILHFCMVDSLLQFFQSTALRSGLFGNHKSGSSYEWPRSLRLLHFRVAAVNDAQNVRVDTACGKQHIKNDTVSVISQRI